VTLALEMPVSAVRDTHDNHAITPNRWLL
jgi:hypothetical protein